MSQDAKLVLASASPRRAQVLRMLGLEPIVEPADVDERVEPGEVASAHVDRLARAKAEAVGSSYPGALSLGADTVVVRDGRILCKPRDPDDALAMLLSLAGRRHQVASGLALVGPHGIESRVEIADVEFRAFGREEAEAYVATGEPFDKAGGYGIQGMGAALVTRVRGDYFTVVGLPLVGFLELLRDCGWRYSFGKIQPLS